MIRLQSAEDFLRSPVPESRNGSRFGKELAHRLIRMADRPEPAPMEWVWDGLIPVGFATSVIGDGGTGKSMFASRLACSVALGQPFLGRAIRQGEVLILDAELNADEALRRAYRMGRGLGMDRLPRGMTYLQLPESLRHQETIDFCIEAIEEVRPCLTILDSFSVACSGMDLKGPEEVIGLMNAMKRWGSCLLLDHIPKPTLGNANMTGVRAYGTVFKFNLARSVLQLARAESGALRLAQIKSNFGALQPPIGIAMIFGEDTVTMEEMPLDHERLVPVTKASTDVRVLQVLRDCGAAGADPRSLAREVQAQEKTVRNALTQLKSKSLVTSLGGRWIATAAVAAEEELSAEL